MDAPEEDLDIKLQKVSSELIVAFDERLASFLRKPDGSVGYRVRSRVRAREASHLMSNVRTRRRKKKKKKKGNEIRLMMLLLTIMIASRSVSRAPPAS